MAEAGYILTLSCPDKFGIVHAVTGLLARHNLTILSMRQFSDPTSNKFFMRVQFGPAESELTSMTSLAADLVALKADIAGDTFDCRPASQKPRVLITISKIGYCLHDLLFRIKNRQLLIEVPAIASNHTDYKPLAEAYGIEFYHLPVTKDTKLQQETKILKLIYEKEIDLVVLARYMQVLSPGLCKARSGRIINIHHSFLPSFKGAKPYHQAYDRGVKIIGATAHVETEDLDEGPVIEQRIAHVNHSMTPEKLVQEGSNIEAQVLATAVK